MGEQIAGLSVRQAAHKALEAITYLLKSAELPASLPDAGITDQSKVKRWAVEAHAERRLLSRCAKNLTVEDIEKIYQRAFEPR